MGFVAYQLAVIAIHSHSNSFFQLDMMHYARLSQKVDTEAANIQAGGLSNNSQPCVLTMCMRVKRKLHKNHKQAIAIVQK